MNVASYAVPLLEVKVTQNITISLDYFIFKEKMPSQK